MPTNPKDFPPHSLRGMSPDQLREYARTRVHLSPRGGIGEIDSIPFAKITTAREMHDTGVYGLPEEDTEYAWAIYKGKEPLPVDEEGHLAIPYLVLGFDLDRGDVRYTVVSPRGAGLGKLLGDANLPPPPQTRPRPHTEQSMGSRRGAGATTNSEADQFLTRFVFERFFAAGAEVFPVEITLAVGGLLISGRPISAKRFFDRMGARLREAAGDAKLEDIGRQLQELFPSLNSGMHTGLLSPRDLNRIREREFDHCHLEKVTIRGPGPQPIRVELWRGQLADITGWTFGLPGEANTGT